MFNEKYHTPVSMFGLEHILIILFFIAVIVLLYVFRKKFMNSSLLDKIFRYSVATALLLFETGLYLFRAIVEKESFSIDYLPLELCAITMFLTAFALFFNNAKLIKIIFFWALTGATLSILVIDMSYSLPHFRAIQFFCEHFLFMLGNLYFLFTEKIELNYKSLLISSGVLIALATPIYFLNLLTEKNYMFVLKAPSELESIGNMLGSFYTPVYVLLIFGLFNLWYLLVWGLPKLKQKIIKSKELKKIEK